MEHIPDIKASNALLSYFPHFRRFPLSLLFLLTISCVCRCGHTPLNHEGGSSGRFRFARTWRSSVNDCVQRCGCVRVESKKKKFDMGD